SMHAKHLDWKIKSYFESTPALEWSYLDFLKSLRPYCISGEHSLDDQQSIWRKRYLTFLSNILEEEQDYDIKEHATFLLRQEECRPFRGIEYRSSALYFTVFSAVAQPGEGVVLLWVWGVVPRCIKCRVSFLQKDHEKHPSEEESFWDGVRIEKGLIIKEDIFDKKSQVEVLNILCVSRSQKAV
ncbi:18834_t:CDS:2, partial [Acaulospora morrowiae]